ncbi:hypothetical protein KSS87_012228 [Heliosperma pusillum]|nr:hypothetical protein KSS87_012228 [Heliosperma pusillum]
MATTSSFLVHQVPHIIITTPSHIDLRHTCGTNVPTPPSKHNLHPTRKNQNRVNTFRVKSDTESTHFSDLSKKTIINIMEGEISDIDHAELRDQFLALLRSRRSHQVPLTVEQAKPVTDPMYQDNPPPRFSEAMESCPKVDVENFRELLVEENMYLYTEASEQGRLPVLILSMKQTCKAKRPAIVFLHSTHKCKEWLRPLLEAYASRGYFAVAIDSRYHGERASSLTTYREALVSSWKKGDTMPFIFDTVWDLIKLGDYLTQQRDDIDSARIGITGESLGGMHAWFAAFADTRYAVVVPIIGVQGFRWAIDNDKWQGRVDSIKAVFEEARVDLGKSVIDKDVVEKVWDRINPGLTSQFDAPYTIPAIAPRPLLILNGEEDPRCPLPGLDIPKSKAETSYKAHNADSFKVVHLIMN